MFDDCRFSGVWARNLPEPPTICCFLTIRFDVFLTLSSFQRAVASPSGHGARRHTPCHLTGDAKLAHSVPALPAGSPHCRVPPPQVSSHLRNDEPSAGRTSPDCVTALPRDPGAEAFPTPPPVTASPNLSLAFLIADLFHFPQTSC